MQQHGQPKVKQRPQPVNWLVRLIGKVFRQHGSQIGDANPASLQHVAVSVFGQIGLSTVDVPSHPDSVVERVVFKSVQGVVMHEHFDRPLGRQQVLGVFHNVPQPIQSLGILRRQMLGSDLGGR